MRLYDCLESGNAYKARLLLTQLGIPFERTPMDILERETRTPAFLAINPNGRVPVLEWPDGRRLAESNAILCHLAEGTPFLPTDAWQRALCLQWLFFEQYSHEPYVAVVRFWHHAGLALQNRAQLPEKMRGGQAALAVMEQHLEHAPFFAGGAYSIADIALYAYTHVAGEGGFDLAPYPHLRGWLDRIRKQPRHILITDEPGTLVPWVPRA